MEIKKTRGLVRNYLLMPLALLGITLGLSCKDKGLAEKVQDSSTLKIGQVVKDTGYFKIIYVGNILDMKGTDPNDRGKMRIEDIDGDNDLDFAIVDNEGHAFVYQNIVPIRPIGADPNARVVYGSSH